MGTVSVCVHCRSGTSSPWGSASESDEEPGFRVSPARRSLSHYAREQLQSQSSNNNRGADNTSRPTVCITLCISLRHCLALIKCWVDTRRPPVSGMWPLCFGYHFYRSQRVLIGIRCMPAVLRHVAAHASKWLHLVGHGSQCTAHAWEFTADLLPTVMFDQT